MSSRINQSGGTTQGMPCRITELKETAVRSNSHIQGISHGRCDFFLPLQKKIRQDFSRCGTVCKNIFAVGKMSIGYVVVNIDYKIPQELFRLTGPTRIRRIENNSDSSRFSFYIRRAQNMLTFFNEKEFVVNTVINDGNDLFSLAFQPEGQGRQGPQRITVGTDMCG